MGFTTTFSDGSTAESSGRGASEEKKMSMAMKRGMDRLSFEPALVVMDYMRSNSNMQMRMMDLIMSFLNTWATNYQNGVTREGQPMHRLGEMSAAMLDAASAPRKRPGRLP